MTYDGLIQGYQFGHGIYLCVPFMALDDYLAAPRETRWCFYLEAAMREHAAADASILHQALRFIASNVASRDVELFASPALRLWVEREAEKVRGEWEDRRRAT